MNLDNKSSQCCTDSWIAKWLQVTVTHPELGDAANVVKDWTWDAFCNRNHAQSLLVMCGLTGTGKTHLAQHAVDFLSISACEAWRRGHWRGRLSTWSSNWPKLMLQEPKPDLGGLFRASAALLDDVGSEVDRFNQGTTIERLRTILEARKGQFTILTTNIMPEQWPAQWDARVADRLLRHSRIVELRHVPSFAIWSRQNAAV